MESRVVKIFQQIKKIKGAGMILFLLVIGGMLLVLSAVSEGELDAQPEQPVSGEVNMEEYRLELQKSAAALISCMSGVEKASVVITLDGTGESVYVFDESRKNSDSITESEKNAVFESSKGGDNPVTSCEIYPQIRGVGIVCPQARDEKVKAEITALVAGMLNVSYNRIYVTF